jgi:hypothetical protein
VPPHSEAGHLNCAMEYSMQVEDSGTTRQIWRAMQHRVGTTSRSSPAPTYTGPGSLDSCDEREAPGPRTFGSIHLPAGGVRQY